MRPQRATYVGQLAEYVMPEVRAVLHAETEDGLWYHKPNDSTGILRMGVDTVSAVELDSGKPRSAGDCADQKGTE